MLLPATSLVFHRVERPSPHSFQAARRIGCRLAEGGWGAATRLLWAQRSLGEARLTRLLHRSDRPMHAPKAGLVRRVPSSQLLGAKPGSFVKSVPSRQQATAPPPDADDEELVLCQRAASCPAALPPFAAWSPPLLLQSVADELVTESALHVSAVQRMQCVHSGYNVQVSAVSAAPSLVARPQAGGVSTVSDDSRAVAACYAMPPDAAREEETEWGDHGPGGSAAAHLRQSRAPMPTEGLLSLQQRSSLAAGEYTNELLAAATSTRRQRKRAVLRALRTSRNLVTKLSTSLLSVGYLDGNDDDDGTPTE